MTVGHEEERCPECMTALNGRPFCPHDGYFKAPFVLGGRYAIAERLGRGGMGVVFGGTHLAMDKPIAVKVMRDDIAANSVHADRFLREARIASGLRHENIVGVLDFGRDENLGVLYLVMDRLRGTTLADVMEQGLLPMERSLAILTQLARALAHAHEQGVVHRDIKPRNVMVEQSKTRGDLVRLCDFGLSRMSDGDDRVTSTGQIIGTPAYMAPEQVRGDAEQGPATDIYALGSVAYELLCGMTTFAASTPMGLLAAKLRDTPAPMRQRRKDSNVPAELDELVLRCLRQDASLRPTARELEVAFAKFEASAVLRTPVELIGSMVGSYRVTALVGAGGMGSVYRAEHPTIGSVVAIKVLVPELASSPDVVERFILEARASTALQSPHIPRYHDFGRLADGRAYAVMDFLEGETIAGRIERLGPMPYDQVAVILADVARALGTAHQAGIIHRDIKPDNIFLARDPSGAEVVKVLDFGIAKVISDTSPDGKLTQANMFVGTLAYCAPEQAFGQAVGPATDVYALAATAFEMLTGREPIVANDVTELFHKKMTEAPKLRAMAPHLPPELEWTLSQALAPMAAERIPDMPSFVDSVARWPGVHIAPLRISSRPGQTPTRATPTPTPIFPATIATRTPSGTVFPDRSSRATPLATPVGGASKATSLLLGAGAAAVLVLVAGGVFWAMRKPDAEPTTLTAQPPNEIEAVVQPDVAPVGQDAAVGTALPTGVEMPNHGETPVMPAEGMREQSIESASRMRPARMDVEVTEMVVTPMRGPRAIIVDPFAE